MAPNPLRVFVLLPALLLLLLLDAGAHARTKTPLLDGDDTKTRTKAAECVFGKQVRELGSQWIPDLGPPIGVLYCTKCECVPVQRKRRIVARVQCRSIKSECPEPTCAEPVHFKGRCCKTCPGDGTDPNVAQDQEIVSQSTADEEEKNNKHYAALLTGRSSLVLQNDYMKPIPIDKNNVVATGRFTFHKKNLHYSFYVSDKAARPRALQFVDGDGNILEEFQLSSPGGLVFSTYQNTTRKICGIWRRLPRDYRKLVKQEKMYAVLIWGVKDQAEFTLSGQLRRYVGLASETFSSLLEPAPGTSSLTMAGAGGTAIVSISTLLNPGMVHLEIAFNGLFTPQETDSVPINVTLSLEDKRIIIQEKIKIKKPAVDLNFINISHEVTPTTLRLLTRGRLLLTLSSFSSPDSLRLSGHVITRVTCELFQAVLASPSTNPNSNPHGTSGLAWLYLNNEGAIVYNVHVDNLKMPDLITLVDLGSKRKTELEDLTTPHYSNGWANGTIERLSHKVLEPLYAGNLGVNVAIQSDSSLILGRLTPKPVADARDAPEPFLLKRENYTLPPSAVGIAWLAVDADCHIHYDVTVAGLGGADRSLQLDLDLLPMLAPGAPVMTRHLDDFHGLQVEGSPVSSLNREELNRLDSGVGFMKVKDPDGVTLLAATVQHVPIPPTCRPSYTDNNVPTISFDNGDGQGGGECFHEDKFYKEEAQWTSAKDACTMCFCQNGNAKCDTMVCPEVHCPNSAKIRVGGECCPVCANGTAAPESNVPTKCIFNGVSYSSGSRFHPFLIPNGFDTCTECFCEPLTLEIKCSRISNEKVCCKNCQKVDHSLNGTFHSDDSTSSLVPELHLKKEVPLKSAQQVLAEGGCKNLYNPKKPYANGSEYHPLIDSLGEYKCVTCKCQNGNQMCKRQHCDKLTCEKMFRMRRKGLAANTPEYCCSIKECKKFKHRKGRRPQTRFTS